MASNFGKLDFSVSFNPTSAFPIDARSYFESLNAAKLAAATAKPAGSKDSVYYYGQTLVVVENDLATFYIIQTDNTLVPLRRGDEPLIIAVDTKQFEYDENGNLSLKGFKNAVTNAVLTKNNDGTISWIVPVDAYSKEQTELKIKEAIAGAPHLKRKFVKNIDEIELYMYSHEDAEQYIFMVPTGLTNDSDRYEEYMVISITDGENIVTKYIEKVGSWEVDLTDYAKINDVENALNGKVDKQEGYTLLSPEDQKKLKALKLNNDDLVIDSTIEVENVVGLDAWLAANASTKKGLSENNLTNELFEKLKKSLSINSVEDSQLKVDNQGKLSITALNKDLVTGLNEALEQKASKQEVNSITNVLNSLNQSLNKNIEDVNSLKDKFIWKNI